jgi:hypothetical protein
MGIHLISSTSFRNPSDNSTLCNASDNVHCVIDLITEIHLTIGDTFHNGRLQIYYAKGVWIQLLEESGFSVKRSG